MVKLYLLPAFLFVLWLIRWWRRKMAKKYSLAGKVVMVTGSASEGGLGMSLAIEARRRGAKLVIITGRRMAQLKPSQELVSACPGVGAVEGYELDLDWSPEQLIEAVSHIWEETEGGIDVLINNAGCSYRGNILETKPEVHHSLMQANYFGHVHVISEIARRMSKCGNDRFIVGISSVQGKMSIPYRSAYSASKHAFQVRVVTQSVIVTNRRMMHRNTEVFEPGYFAMVAAELSDQCFEYLGGDVEVNCHLLWSGHLRCHDVLYRLFAKSMSLIFGGVPIASALFSILLSRLKFAIDYKLQRAGYLYAFFDCLRAELSSHSINVLVVSPGYMSTNLSKNALRDSGKKHDLMDKTTSSGLSPETAAHSIANSIEQYENQLILAPWYHKLVIKLREIFPDVFFSFMKKRASSSKAY